MANPEPQRPQLEGWQDLSVLVWEDGRWSVCPPGDRNPIDVPFAEVLALAEPSDARIAPVPDGWVRPLSPTALLACDGSLFGVSTRTDELTTLTDADLTVLDQLHDASTVADLAMRTGRADIGTVLEKLTDLRLASLDPTEVRIPSGLTERLDWPEAFLRPGDAWRDLDGTRIPVLGAYAPTAGPPLALGMIIASMRTWSDGALNERYDLRPPVTFDEARALLEDHTGPAVLLCSNYLWTSVSNHELGEWAKARNPEVLIVHGGPDTPKYPADLERFMGRTSVDIAAIGEGEETGPELLAALASVPTWGDLSGLAEVDGLAFRPTPDEPVLRTGDRARQADLDSLPSPYLSGEFDDLHPAAWDPSFDGVVVIETTRGCPYQCTFCDWGSATMSRIRKHGLDRIEEEMRWLAAHGIRLWMLADANFGILAQDREVARIAARIRGETGFPVFLGITAAKNPTKHLSEILVTLFDGDIATLSSVSLQTRDEATLEAVHRSNISPKRYDELCADFRALGLPLMCDLILGLPGQTPESFKDDLQWGLDHEVTARAWRLQILPNAPMNEETYRNEHQIKVAPDGMVIATSSYDEDDHRHMMNLSMANQVLEHFGFLRHVLRWLQWDHGFRPVDVMDDLVKRTQGDPSSLPLTNWALRYLDYFLIPPVGWGPFYEEIRHYLVDNLGVPESSALDAVLAAQRALMADRNRTYPSVTALDHDYLAYYRDATKDLHVDGQPGRPAKPLGAYPSGVLQVDGDPALLTERMFRRLEEVRPPDLLLLGFWNSLHLELDSPLTRLVTEVRANPGYRCLENVVNNQRRPALYQPVGDEVHTEEQVTSAPVILTTKR